MPVDFLDGRESGFAVWLIGVARAMMRLAVWCPLSAALRPEALCPGAWSFALGSPWRLGPRGLSLAAR